MHAGRLIDNRRYELRSAAPGTDYRHALAVQVVLVFPARRVEGDTLEGANTGNVRHGR
jgi:hypothetical protein